MTNNRQQRYIALLCGINVGGNKKIKMADLRAMVENLGFNAVKTVLASGNIAWDTELSDTDEMRDTIQNAIASTFGFSVNIIVFPAHNIQALIESDPFAGVEVTKATRLYATFLPAPTAANLRYPMMRQRVILGYCTSAIQLFAVY